MFKLVRTTRDYEGPSVAPRVQAALDAAMNNVEEDIDIDALAISNTFQVKVGYFSDGKSFMFVVVLRGKVEFEWALTPVLEIN